MSYRNLSRENGENPPHLILGTLERLVFMPETPPVGLTYVRNRNLLY